MAGLASGGWDAVEKVEGSEEAREDSSEDCGIHRDLAAEDRGRAPVGRWGRKERRSDRYDSAEMGISCVAIFEASWQREDGYAIT